MKRHDRQHRTAQSEQAGEKHNFNFDPQVKRKHIDNAVKFGIVATATSPVWAPVVARLLSGG